MVCAVRLRFLSPDGKDVGEEMGFYLPLEDYKIATRGTQGKNPGTVFLKQGDSEYRLLLADTTDKVPTLYMAPVDNSLRMAPKEAEVEEIPSESVVLRLVASA